MPESPIGFFDSGFGGVSVLAEAIRRYPAEDYLYFGDHGNVPYGEKSLEEIRGHVERAADRMLERGVKALVLACNTATSAAAERLRERLELPVIGMEPALKPASEMRGDGQVLVLATTLALSLPKFQRLMERYGRGAVPLPAPELVLLAEEGCLSGERVEDVLRRITAGVRGKIDGVVLGCTHYSLMREAIEAYFGPEVFVVDGAAGTVEQMARLLRARGKLREPGLRRGSVELVTTGDAARIAPFFWRLLLDRAYNI